MSARSDAGFSPATVFWIIGVAVVAFCGFFTLLAYAPDLRSGDNGGAHALSRSGVGYVGIVRLLGDDAVVSRAERPAVASLLVLTPDASTTGDDVKTLRADHPTLLVVEKWTYTPDPRKPGWARRIGVDRLDMYRDLLKATAGRITMRRDPQPAAVTLRGVAAPWTGRTWRVGRVEHLTTIAGDDAFPLIVDDQGRAVLAEVAPEDGEGDVSTYVLSDPDLLNNLGMASAPRARFADHMLRGLRSGEAPIAFDVTLVGIASGRSILRMALQPPFLAATLCVLAAALLTGVHAAIRFGPAQTADRAVALGKRALADNAAALIKLAKREHAMAPRYAQLVREQAARAVGAPRELTGDAQTDYLDRLAARREAHATLSDLTTKAAAARTPETLLDAARALFRWRSEMTRVR